MNTTFLSSTLLRQAIAVSILTALSFLVSVHAAHAQAPIVMEDWVDQFGSVSSVVDIAEAIDTTGQMYVGGYVDAALPGETHEGASDAFVRKYDQKGNVIWTRQFGTSFNDRVQGVAIGGDDIYVIGETDGDLNMETASGGGDAFIRKYDEDGTEQWTIQFGTDAFDNATGVAVGTGGVYVVGSTLGSFPGFTIGGNGDVFIRKFDTDGNALWTSQFGTPDFQEAFGVTTIGDEAYMVGVTDGEFPGQTTSGGEDAFIRKFDATGSSTWTRQFGTADFDQASSVTNDGTDVFIIGETSGTLPSHTNQGGSDVFIRAYDSSGNEQWTSQFGTNDNDRGTGVGANTTGVYVGGLTDAAFSGYSNSGSSDAFMRKFTTSGTEEWTYQFGTAGSDQPQGVAANETGLFIVGFTSGTFPGETSSGNLDVFVARLIQDSDSDNIFDEVDTDVSNSSDDFDDGDTDGLIVTRGDQDLTITDDRLSSTTGVRIQADPGGGLIDATISLCGGISTIFVSAGDDVVATCGSVTLTVLNGEVEATFFAEDGTTATADLAPDVELTFEPETVVFSAPPTNATSVEVLVDDGQGGQETVTVDPGESEVSGGMLLNPVKDGYMRKGKTFRNEGANPLLRVKGTENGGGINRALIGFDPAEISAFLASSTFSQATLVLHIQGTNDKWGNKNNRGVDVHPLLTDFDEGNGLGGDLPGSESTRGSGTGATWDCDVDDDISNKTTECDPLWDGGSFGTTTSGTVIHTNDITGSVSWDVTADVLAGVTNWLVKKNKEHKKGKVWYYSTEGAANAGDMTIAPQLVLED